MKNLHLTLQRKWFYLIASGEKVSEYRENKPYWRQRFLDSEGFAVEFDEIHFRNGYGKNAPFMRVEWKGLGEVTGGKWPTEHGEKVGDNTFVISLGKVLELKVA